MKMIKPRIEAELDKHEFIIDVDDPRSVMFKIYYNGKEVKGVVALIITSLAGDEL